MCQTSERYEGIYKMECLLARILHSNWRSKTFPYVQEKRANKNQLGHHHLGRVNSMCYRSTKE